jgi:glyoxylase-like metal-dependent hydrolase (beta-lactamase superfamily II)
MLKTTCYGPVTRFDLARSIAGRGRYWTTCYYLDGTLNDSGCAHTAHELAAALADRPVRRIVTTHSHEDHFGAHGLLQRRRDPPEALAHPLALPILADPRGRQPLQPYRRLFWGYPEPCSGQPVEDGAVIEAGRYRLQAIATPGHSPDHLCLFEPQQGWLFSGDLYVGGHDRALGASYDIWQIVASLKRVAALPATRLFPASARVRERPAEELAAKIAYLEETGARVLDLHRQGWSVGAITRAVCGGPMFVEVMTLGHFSRRWLVLSFLRGAGEIGATPAR